MTKVSVDERCLTTVETVTSYSSGCSVGCLRDGITARGGRCVPDSLLWSRVDLGFRLDNTGRTWESRGSAASELPFPGRAFPGTSSLLRAWDGVRWLWTLGWGGAEAIRPSLRQPGLKKAIHKMLKVGWDFERMFARE